jgi:hypothetical protein
LFQNNNGGDIEFCPSTWGRNNSSRSDYNWVDDSSARRNNPASWSGLDERAGSSNQPPPERQHDTSSSHPFSSGEPESFGFRSFSGSVNDLNAFCVSESLQNLKGNLRPGEQWQLQRRVTLPSVGEVEKLTLITPCRMSSDKKSLVCEYLGKERCFKPDMFVVVVPSTPEETAVTAESQVNSTPEEVAV